MINTLVGIIFACLVLGLLWWAVTRIMAVIPIAEPFKTIIYVLCVLVGGFIVISILAQLLGIAGFPVVFPVAWHR